MNNPKTSKTRRQGGVRFRIQGAAGPYEAAVITAVLEHTLAEERRNGSSQKTRRFTNWTLAGLNHRYVSPRFSNGAKINGVERPPSPRARRPKR